MQLVGFYDKLWKNTLSAFTQNGQQIDLHLADKAKDLRRGVTMVIRPSSSVQDNIKNYLAKITAICPEQYFYQPEELHVTVLSIISGTEFWRQETRHLPAYRKIIRNVLERQKAFQMSFHGITASPAGIMIQGFPADNSLTQIRESLRAAFKDAEFGHVLDRRYKINTAHITIMRFRTPNVDWKRLMPLLEEGRKINFGHTTVRRLQLIWGDWYASANIVRTLENYPLC